MIIAILQARMSSTRLPGKVMKPVLGTPMIERQLGRLARVSLIDRIIVATSTDKSDNPLVELCEKLNIDHYRGSLNNVLDRYYQAASKYHPDIVVRLTGDCPLADPDVIDDCVEYFLRGNFDYVSNTIERTFPIGLDVEVFRFEALKQAWQDSELPSEREHVTPFIKNHPERFVIGLFKNDFDLSHHRWTVDEPDDFEFISAVYKRLYRVNPRFSMHDILHLIEKYPELAEINYHIVHGENYQKSLREDSARVRTMESTPG